MTGDTALATTTSFGWHCGQEATWTEGGRGGEGASSSPVAGRSTGGRGIAACVLCSVRVRSTIPDGVYSLGCFPTSVDDTNRKLELFVACWVIRIFDVTTDIFRCLVYSSIFEKILHAYKRPYSYILALLKVIRQSHYIYPSSCLS